MRNLLSTKLDLVRIELLTIKQMRGNSANCDTKNSAIADRVFELEQLIEKIKMQREAAK